MEEEAKPFALVLMPFHERFDHVYRQGIKPACNRAGADCERVDEQIFAENIVARVYGQIADADLIVADMTDCNVNVFYEVGYAHALCKDVILLTQDADDIPFDLKGYLTLVYRDVGDLRERLPKMVEYYLRNPTRPVGAVRKLFGPSATAEGDVGAVMPVFNPLTFADFEEAGTRMRKISPRYQAPHEERRVPMYSPCVVLEDYRAYEEIARLFVLHGLAPPRLLRDDQDESNWEANACLVCIGAPRSNNRTHELLQFESCERFLSVEHPSEELDTWRLRLLAPRELVLGTDPKQALGVILRVPNPCDPKNMVIAVFGDRAESTIAAGRYLRTQFRSLADWVGSQPVLLLLAVSGARFERERRVYMATPQAQLFSEPEGLAPYIQAGAGEDSATRNIE